MSQTGVVSWSQTAASNASADSNVNWAEGMAPSEVNDSARAEMASVAKYRDDIAGTLTTGGTSTAYTLTTNQVFSSLTVLNGQKLKVRFNATCGASPTLNVDGLGAKPIQIDNATAVGTSGISANSIWDVTYDNSIPAFILGGYPQTIGTLTATTLTSTTGTITNLTVSGTFTFSLPGKSLMYGDIINGTIVETNSANATTFSLKTLAGADPSTSDPVLFCFRNATNTTGNYVFRQVTAATSVTISAGSTLGASNSTAFRIWIVAFDDAGTIRLGVINCLSGTGIFPLGQMPIASSTAEGGLGAADSAQVFYTGTAVTSKPYLVVGYANYESGLSTAGNWNVDPRLQLYGPGVPLPGEIVQTNRASSGAVATGTTTVPDDDTIPQNTEGDQYMSCGITPTSAANLLIIDVIGHFANSNGSSNVFIAGLFQDATANALVASRTAVPVGSFVNLPLSHTMLAATTSGTTFKYRVGGTAAGTTSFNGNTSAVRYLGGVMNSYIQILERMA